MQLQKCTMKDVPRLALLNKQLIDDEKSDNPMNIKELESRTRIRMEDALVRISVWDHKKGYGV